MSTTITPETVFGVEGGGYEVQCTYGGGRGGGHPWAVAY